MMRVPGHLCEVVPYGSFFFFFPNIKFFLWLCQLLAVALWIYSLHCAMRVLSFGIQTLS